jgi:hypothetical protein
MAKHTSKTSKTSKTSSKAAKAASKVQAAKVQSKAAKAGSKAKAAKPAKPARREATKAGEIGKVRHHMIFQGAELAKDLLAASKYGDNIYLQPKQLAANQLAAINKALASLPCTKGQNWVLDNVEITAKLK